MSGGGSLSSWGIRNPIPAVMLFFVLCVAGLWGFHQLPVARFPDITRVKECFPGAEIISLRTDPLIIGKLDDSLADVPW